MSGKAEDAGAENMQSENMRQDDMRAENAGLESGAAAKLTCGVSVAGVTAACGGSNAKPGAENARAESNAGAKNMAAKNAAAANAAAANAAAANAGAGEDAESAAGPAARPDSVSGVSGRSPRLRVHGFTQPWQTRKLGELFEEYSEKNHPELPPLSVVQGGGTVLRDESDRNLQYDKSGLDRYKAVWENDFILHLRSFEGGLEKATVEGLISPAYHTFRGKGIDPRFYYLYFRSHEFVSKKLVPHIYGIRDGKSIDIEGMKSIDVPYPSVGEQRQIGMFFSGLDRIIRVQERKTEALRLSKKYFLQNMFPRRGESAPRLRVHGFTQPWQTRKLGEMVSVQSGKDYKSLNEGDVPVYGTGGYMLSVSEALSYSEDAIGIGRKGTIDKPFVLRAPFWTVDTLFYCVPKENYDLDFVNVVFQNVNWRVLDESTGVPSLSKKIINEVKAKVPSVGEQRQIGMFFSGLDRIIGVQRRKTEALRLSKKYFLQNMFA